MDWSSRLAARMARPQRHRLLQGYPPVPLMQHPVPGGLPREAAARRTWDGALLQQGPGTADQPLEPAHVAIDRARTLLVGVIPHTLCSPAVRGCGFCTFPHDSFFRRRLEDELAATRAEIDRTAQDPLFAGRPVAAVYYGGATANLAPMEELAALHGVLAGHLDLSGAEVTVEGVPSLFHAWLRSPLSRLADLPARHRRISMGVQTFDPAQLERMGRRRFGDRRLVARVVRQAQALGMTTSADFLVNLPGQSQEQILEDLRAAIGTGLDQICVYHLVLHAGLGTPWSRDAGLLASLPAQAQAVESWLAARQLLLEAGFVQATLTNFERAEVHASDKRFIYEELSFAPERCDALGLGPLSISTFTDLAARRAVKLLRGKRGPFASSLYFPYDEPDLRLLVLTRGLARLRVERQTYRQLFGTDFADDDFPGPVQAVVEAGLATLDGEALALTPRGMFFADSVVGLIAEERVEALRAQAAGRHTVDLLDAPARLYMG